MSKYEPSEKDLGFNPYVTDEETYSKLQYTHYSPENASHRERIIKWKEREKERNALAERLGIKYKPVLTPASVILEKLKR